MLPPSEADQTERYTIKHSLAAEGFARELTTFQQTPGPRYHGLTPTQFTATLSDQTATIHDFVEF